MMQHEGSLCVFKTLGKIRIDILKLLNTQLLLSHVY